MQTNANYVGKQHQQQQGVRSNLKRVAYFSMESEANESNQALRLIQVDGRLCSHIILAFARIEPSGSICLARAEDERHLRDVREFKRQNPHVKVLISVSNLNFPTTPSSNCSSPDGPLKSPSSDQHQQPNGQHVAVCGFLALVQSAQARQKFARSSMEFLQKFHLDGLDLDWEFPNFPHTFNNRENERVGLTKICKELRSAIVENFFNRQVAEQHNQFDKNQGQAQLSRSIYQVDEMSNMVASVEPYLLTVAIAAQETILKSSYELKQLANLCDWFNVMSYDYYLFKPYAPFTGPNAPLNPIMDPFVPYLGKLSFTSTINRLLSEDLEPDKIVMGIPTYARAYRLLFRSNHPAAFTIAYASKGGQHTSDASLTNKEVCEILAQPDTKVAFDERARVPYLLTDDGYTWVSYEDEQSVGEKLQCIRDHQLAGYMTWNLNCDQIPNNRFPLHEALLKRLTHYEQQALDSGRSSTSNQETCRTNNHHGLQQQASR